MCLAGSRPRFTSLHASGIETRAPSTGRTLKGETISFPCPFCTKSRYTRPPRAATARSQVAISLDIAASEFGREGRYTLGLEGRELDSAGIDVDARLRTDGRREVRGQRERGGRRGADPAEPPGGPEPEAEAPAAKAEPAVVADELGYCWGVRRALDIIEDAAMAAEQLKQMITAKSVEPGKYDLMLEPSHMWLTIHESVGHPLELDRVLGYEANFAGTSFATLDKWKTGKFNYGSKQVNFVADKTEPGSLGAVGYDDEGVKTKRWNLVKDGILVGYQAIRDQVHILGEKESHGCCYSQSWRDVQFQRMANVSLQAGKEQLTPEQMLSGIDKGIYIVKDGSFSIDQQRYNFQFGGTVFYEIKNGQIAGMLNDVAYQSNTQEFWNNCVKICDEKDYRLFGSFFDGKGQPSQVSAVSHGSATSRFNGVNVINTGRTI